MQNSVLQKARRFLKIMLTCEEPVNRQQTFILIMRKCCQVNTSSLYLYFLPNQERLYFYLKYLESYYLHCKFQWRIQTASYVRMSLLYLFQYSHRSTALPSGQPKAPWGHKPWQLSTPMRNYQSMTSAEWHLSSFPCFQTIVTLDVLRWKMYCLLLSPTSSDVFTSLLLAQTNWCKPGTGHSNICLSLNCQHISGLLSLLDFSKLCSGWVPQMFIALKRDFCWNPQALINDSFTES